MKILKLYSLLVLLVYVSIQCTSIENNNSAEIRFEVKEYDFGELELNADGNCSFKFLNPGETPLIIQNVKTSCGCTVPQWPKKPVKPDKNGQIEISYDTSRPGMFSKIITVFFNGQDSPATLTIKGSVKYPPKTET